MYVCIYVYFQVYEKQQWNILNKDLGSTKQGWEILQKQKN